MPDGKGRGSGLIAEKNGPRHDANRPEIRENLAGNTTTPRRAKRENPLPEFHFLMYPLLAIFKLAKG